MNYVIDKSIKPQYLQLYRLLRRDIVEGSYAYGSRMPSKRVLAEETGLSTVTVEHALGLLCDEGYLTARQRSGFFVAFRRSDGFMTSSEESAAVPKAQRPAAGDDLGMSADLLGKTMRRVLAEKGDVILARSPNTGLFELRDAIARCLARNRGINVSPDRIAVGSGAEYLYGLIVELFGRDCVFALESPSYEKIEQVYRAADAECEMLPLAADGIESAALSASKARVLHTTPYRSFPSGVTASASKRHEYIAWADKPGRYIIEDDFESEFSVSAKPAETLFSLAEKDNVIYMNTFSKTVSPSLRVGYMVLPEKLTEIFNEKLGFYSCTVPTFEQLVLARLLDNGDFERHVNRVRRLMRKG